MSQRNKLTGAYTQQYRAHRLQGRGAAGRHRVRLPRVHADRERAAAAAGAVHLAERVVEPASLRSERVQVHASTSGGLLRDGNDTSILRVTDAAANIPLLSTTPVNITYGSQSSLANSFMRPARTPTTWNAGAPRRRMCAALTRCVSATTAPTTDISTAPSPTTPGSPMGCAAASPNRSR